MDALSKEKEYADFLLEIKGRIRNAQYEALKAVNKELISLYWDLGRKIVEKQEKFGWGKSVVEKLSEDLQKEYPGIGGFSARNLWCMRNFFKTYSNNAKLQPMVAEISWAKNIAIMEKCKDDLEREFYIRCTKRFGWTKSVLIHQIENKSYEKQMIGQNNFEKSIPEKYQKQASLAVKDEYTFDFLELGEEYSERELESGIIGKIRQFLLEMGGHFCFIGSQYRIEVDGEEYFIDLLLYHRKLKRLIAIELKTGKFKPEYSGKMQFYLSALDDLERLEGENPSIGIIICKEKSRITVDYALRDSRRPIGVATYRITPSLPAELARYLPSSEEIGKKLEKI